MCGISGLATAGTATLDIEDRLTAIDAAMAHRGPDDAGMFITSDGRIGIANRRLAIRDLSPAGHMPMATESGSTWITYNGEIYNLGAIRQDLEARGHRFRSRSDTEAIIRGYREWGEQVVDHLVGMFAFAIVDLEGSQRKIFLARDRLGIKPLYYSATPQGLAFASELKALRQSGVVKDDVSPQAVATYLLMGSVPDEWTIYEQCQAVPAGCTVTWSDGHTSIRQYWSPPSENTGLTDLREAADSVRGLLKDAVKSHLVSDVPLGVFLSGGLDSSTVAVLMRAATDGPIRTCSMVFEEESFSEATYSRAVAEAIGAAHHERVISSGDVLNSLERIWSAMDQPTIDGVNAYFVSETAREAGLTVALSGLGGDELFGGYPNTFRGVPQVLRVTGVLTRVPGASSLTRAAVRASGSRRLAKLADVLESPSELAAFIARRGLFSRHEVRALLAKDLHFDFSDAFEPTGGLAGTGKERGPNQDLFSWISGSELRTYTNHQLLRDTDVMSMAHSLEVRVPFLDHPLVEAVLRMPQHVKEGRRPKSLLIDAIGDLLPPTVRQERRKQGFTFPFDRWLRKELRGLLTDSLSADQIKRMGWLNHREVARVGESFLAGKAHWSRVWSLIALVQWMDHATANVPNQGSLASGHPVAR